MLGDVELLVGVSVDAARRFAKEPLLRRLGVMGDAEASVVDARRRLAIDEVRG